MDKDNQLLQKYFPARAAEMVREKLYEKGIQLRISRRRTSKLGDYRPPQNGWPHRISLNHDLNPYHMLIVFVHELAHLEVYEQYGRSAKPHGREWKQTFRALMQPFLAQSIFPDDVRQTLNRYLLNAKAANGSDMALSRVLAGYDGDGKTAQLLESLPEGSLFQIHNGRVFKKASRVRKRYKCLCMATNRMYLFNPLAEVQMLQQDKRSVP